MFLFKRKITTFWSFDTLSNLKVNEHREQERNKSKEEKHGTSDWEDPESENYVEWQKEQEEEDMMQNLKELLIGQKEK